MSVVSICNVYEASICMYISFMMSTISMQPLVMHLACVTLRMSMEEALAAATINAAAALGLSDRCGSLEKNKMADILILNAPR